MQKRADSAAVAAEREDGADAFIDGEFARSGAAIAALLADGGYRRQLRDAAAAVAAVLRAGGKVLTAGNGGSAADALHIAAELAGRFHFDRPGLAALALAGNPALVSAVGNDHGFEQIFARQVEAIGRPGDLLIALSTSGRSPNILAAARAARALGMTVIGLTGRTGGDLKALTDLCLCAPADATPQVQECHLVTYHALCGWVEAALFPDERPAGHAR